MRDNYYITREGILIRKENTIYFTTKNEKIPIPVDSINALYILSPTSFSSGVIHFLLQKGIPVFFFNYFGFYDGTLWPKQPIKSGIIVIKQSEKYLNIKSRGYLARQFVFGASKNMIRNLERYKLYNAKREIESLLDDLQDLYMINKIMSIEARIHKIYYNSVDQILPDNFKIGIRTRRPPTNKGNSLISFGNSLLYSTTLSEIYYTPLNPTISFLHEPGERRFSLSLDISEIFKPLLVDRLIFFLLNKRIIKENDFDSNFNGVLLKDSAKKLFVKYYDERLNKKIKHRKLSRNVSYRHLIRLECYKIAKYVLGVSDKYEPFVIWW